MLKTKLIVWGDAACFTDPRIQPERSSYPIITESAARGILEAIYWKPEISWVIDNIRVINPIQYGVMLRNEIGSKVSNPTPRDIVKDRQQRHIKYLKDVKYGIEAHVKIIRNDRKIKDPEVKHITMFEQRAKKGKFFQTPYLGCREFTASFELVESFPESSDNLPRDLGFILKDLKYIQDEKGKIIESNQYKRSKREPIFSYAYLEDGYVKYKDVSTEK